MEEIKNNNHQNHEHCEMCSHHDCGKNKMCGMGFCGYNMKHRVLRWILGILIIFLLLWLGMRIGEFKAMCGSGFNRVGLYNQVGGFGPGMR